jgi:hypothetical protein
MRGIFYRHNLPFACLIRPYLAQENAVTADLCHCAVFGDAFTDECRRYRPVSEDIPWFLF